MGFGDKGNEDLNKKEASTAPKADIEIKNARIAQQVDKEFSQYIENKDEWKQSIDKLRTEARGLHKGIMENVEKQFEEQFSSGELLTHLQNIKSDIAQNGPETTMRNRGAGYTLPLQLILRAENFNIDADGMQGPKTAKALDDFCLYYNIQRVHPGTVMLTADEMDAVITAYQTKYAEAMPREKTEKKEKKLSPEQLEQLENQKYKSALFEYFVNSGMRPRLETILPSSTDKGRASDMITSKKQKELHDIMRTDNGVKTIAFGPTINRTGKAWLDLSSFDIKKNPNITLTVHTNNNFETSFVVDAREITDQNDRGEIHVDFLTLYQKTRQALIPAYFQKQWGGSVADVKIV